MTRNEREAARWRERGGLSADDLLAPIQMEAGAAAKESPWWIRMWPLELLILAGTAIGAITLVRMLDAVGRDRVVTWEAPKAGSPASVETDTVITALGVVDEEYIAAWVQRLSATELGGRDTPSVGLERAQEAIAEEFRRLGLVPVGASTAGASPARPSEGLQRPPGDRSLSPYYRPFLHDAAFFGRVPYEAPDAAGCVLEAGGDAFQWELGRDFVPLARSSPEDPTFAGEAFGELVFAGYGIDSVPFDYDDFGRVDVQGKVAVILAGEPTGGGFTGRFKDSEVTAEACLWNKIDALAREGAAGAIVVEHAEAALDPAVEYRWTRAYWNPPSMDKVRAGLPTLRVRASVGEALLGVPPAQLVRSIRDTGAPVVHPLPMGKRVRMRAATVRTDVELRNIVAALPGRTDGRYLVIGAHLDHIGVGPRGRIGRGADDNASGVAAMLSIARAAMTPEGRQLLGETTLVFCAFTGEEDGRVGSTALVADLPLPASRCAGMLNLDMIGRGPVDSAVIFGLAESPRMRLPFRRALRTAGHGLARVQEVTSPSFFPRSDHYAFYEAGIPALFFFEDWPHQVGVYHTWLDVPEEVSAQKVASTARLAALVAFELAR